MLRSDSILETGIDGAALKPAECDVSRGSGLPFDTVVIDYEGREHLPDRETLESLADGRELRLTTPVRADGFDPLGDDSLADRIPAGVRRVLVAGHAAYLDGEERSRAVAPRLGASRGRPAPGSAPRASSGSRSRRARRSSSCSAAPRNVTCARFGRPGSVARSPSTRPPYSRTTPTPFSTRSAPTSPGADPSRGRCPGTRRPTPRPRARPRGAARGGRGLRARGHAGRDPRAGRRPARGGCRHDRRLPRPRNRGVSRP